jgi:hypothetical protein
LLIFWLLLENVDELHVFRFRADAVDDREREFAFCEIFAKPFVVRVFGGGEVLVVVTDLEDYAHDVDEWDAVSVGLLVEF